MLVLIVLIEIVGLAVVETLIVTLLLVSGVFPQGKLPVKTQVMMSPLESAVEVNVAELVPTLLPLRFH
jgi:hypothetical protein